MSDSPEITLYNTRTRRKERLEPVVPGCASMYVCGPTVYDRAHIGNARPVVVFDVLFRLLRHTYGEGNVTYVRNITDVEDKINARARESGRSIGEITAETTRWYHEDMDALGALPPTKEPRATEYVGEMIAMIAVLIEKKKAYPTDDGHVLFDVRSYPEYGQLARRSLEDMRVGARAEVATSKRDPMDFVLWKPSDAETPGWDSPWGRGRPGWHIECSAMARALLGAEFDIHGGGVDLAFPHHENELAQSICAHPEEGFARVWMHNGMLNIEGEKMSKSHGNFFTVRDLLDQGIPGEVIRFVLLSTHYSQPLDWTAAKINESWRVLDWMYRMVGNEPFDERWPANERVLSAIAADLNTHEATLALRRLAGEIDHEDSSTQAIAAEVKRTANLLGLLSHTQDEWFRRGRAKSVPASEIIAKLIVDRGEAKLRKDYKTADAIRQSLTDAGVRILDGKGETTFELTAEFDPTKLEALR